MRLTIGTRVGPYEIVGWLGAGGMGEVYRARDSRLARDVAVKLIAEGLGDDTGRQRRFEQEARAAGQLNHSSLLAVYDVGIHTGTPYIVSELLEGESMGRRLSRGALSSRLAIDYARQAAEGLAAAHERGIVHRDIKPDNLFLTSDGRIKVLDFGIAKLTQRDDQPEPDVRLSTRTAEGVTLGSPGYMSPEQVRGEAVDARSDIFALGAVLFLMLTGRPAFVRQTPADTLAAILNETPVLAPDAPPDLERLVSRCLEKSCSARFQSARDLAFALEGLSDATGVTRATHTPRPWSAARTWMWPLAAGVAGAVVTAAVMLPRGLSVETAVPVVISAELDPDVTIGDSITVTFGQSLAISPKGDMVAFLGRKGADGSRQLHVRRLDRAHVRSLPVTENAIGPFFSPDGTWLAFFADGQLKKVAVTGGVPTVLAPAAEPRGGAWGEDDVLVFTPGKTSGTRLMRVSASGGRVEPLGPLADGEVIQVWPQWLPQGKGVLYTGSAIPGSYNDANLMVQPLAGGPARIVHRGGYHGRYLPSGSPRGAKADATRGHLVYVHDGALFAVPFDLERLQVTGSAVQVVSAVTSNAITGGAQMAFSDTGTVVFSPGPPNGSRIALQLVDQQGHGTAVQATPANTLNPAFARDGRLAVEMRDAPPNIWLLDRSGLAKRLTSDPVRAIEPTWTPDGRRIAFASARGDASTLNLWWQRADWIGEAQRLTHSTNQQMPGSWDASGRILAFEELHPVTGTDIMILTMIGDEASGWTPAATPTVFLNSHATEREPMFSPDGRWLAYVSDHSGQGEVYVRPFPGPGREVRVSQNGGITPTWSRTRNELYYGVQGRIMQLPYHVAGATFRADEARAWSEVRYLTRGPNRMFDLHPDGKRIALAPAPAPAGNHLTFLFNFFQELHRVAPIGTP